MKGLRIISLALLACVLGISVASGQSWQPLTNQPTVTLGPMLQLRDGRLLIHEEQNGDPRNWYFLTPDSTGSYVNGQITLTGQLPSNYSPFYFSSQVMLDGVHILVEGGEYNFGSGDETNIGALGTLVPFTGNVSWVNNAPPPGWGNIGDAQSVLLSNGQYLQGSCCRTTTAIYNGPNTWIISGSTQINPNEAGWTLLASGKVSMTDAFFGCGSGKSSESYDPGSGTWSCGPQTPVPLWTSPDHELGAAVLMYNGKVLQFGGVPSATAIYDPVSNTWAAGPNPPNGLDQADGPAALEPNGKVLAMLGSGLFTAPCQFVEYDPVANTLTNTVNDGTQCPADPSFVGHLMILPTGQIMSTDLSSTVEIYTPAAGVVSGVAPTIIPAANVYLGGSKNNLLYGLQLNGLSENNKYGDDYQAATNYPLIRFSGGGKVWYGFTHDDSDHSIAPKHLGFTHFDLNPAMPPGTYQMQVVTNGIGSNIVNIHVR
jgi:hypothetical protein